MTDHRVVLDVDEYDDRFEATQPRASVVGSGRTIHEAVVDYVERARQASQEAEA